MGVFTRKATSTEVSEKDLVSSSVSSVLSETEYARLQKNIHAREPNWFLRFFISSTPRPVVPNEKIYPLLTANLFSILTFHWVSDIIKVGYARRIENEDLYKLGTELDAGVMNKKLRANLEKRIAEFEKKNPGKRWTKWVLLKAINDTFKKRFWLVAGCSKFVADTSQITTPLVVRALVRYIQEKEKHDPGVGHAVGLAICISIMQMISALAVACFFHNSMVVGAQVKATLMNEIYKKTFVMSTRARFEYPNGKINSLVMTDLNRIDLAVGTFLFIPAFPVSFSIATVVLCVNLDAYGLIGIAIILCFIFSVYFFNKKLKKLRIESTGYVDKRVRAINEIINTLKMIKFYCWEKPYYNIVEQFRAKEKKFILKMQLLRSFLNTGISTITMIAAMVTFLIMINTSGGKNFNSSSIFSAITLFNMLRMPLNLIPLSTSFAIDASVALGRVSEFLQLEEGEDTVDRHELEESSNAIEVQDATFQWDVEEDEGTKLFNSNKNLKPSKSNMSQDTEEIEDLGFPGLKGISLTIKRGELVIVTGSVGTGKTSLLNAIEGSMRKESGESRFFGSLTFCSYPWIQNATIRENIIFGLPYNKEKYDSVVKACALDVDFSVLPGGDMIEVGERGITLSGGQKARINLARAVYADRDIILLDDVLSAVDARVGKHIMNECICGLLAGKTRILATHQLSLVGSADRIIILNGSGSLEIGTQDELLSSSIEFKNLMEYSKEAEEEEDELLEDDIADDIILDKKEMEVLSRQVTQITRAETHKDDENSEDDKNVVPETTEARSVGSISFSLYYKYMRLGAGRFGIPILLFFLLVFFANGFLQLFYSVWLSFWLSDKFPNLSKDQYQGVFIGLVFAACVSYGLLFSIMAWINNNAGLRLFNLSSSRLLKTPMAFMDVTPLGRILNRFTKDVDTLDTDMIEQLRLFVSSVNLVGATIILCACYIPWFLIAVPAGGFCYYLLFTYYKRSALDIKRLESTNRSFVFSLFNETLSGMKVIKSYSSTSRFLNKYEELIDLMNSAYFLTFANQRWLSVRLDVISSLMTAFVSLMCACGVFSVNSSSAGLLVSYMVQTCALMSLLMRSMTQVENDFNSVERLFEYAFDLPQEGPFEIENAKPDQSWPQSGSIDFKDVSLAYREGLPLVLKHVTFDVKGGEKIGVCGRTGAGKSTIMNALFRISPLASGQIIIDDVDIGAIGLDDLRSRLSIIPQDPVLFHGTIRQNLDPFGNSTDQELWDSLRRSWLVEEGAAGVGKYTPGDVNIKTLHKFHLDQLVEDDGANFSLGERQLLALARALVRNTKILILDEATSSVDYETDAKIQSTIVNEFKHCTILCIAHRLKTILNYDRILVLDKGEIHEFDTPFNLFKLGGIFTEMCQRSDITEQDFLDLLK